MKRIVGSVLLACVAAAASAKLPPPSDEAKAKAAEATARTAYNNKVAEYQLCKTTDRIAATYLAEARKAGKDLQPTATPACTDPGPFSYTPPDSKPLEAAGAHSPPATAATPPNTTTPAAATDPAKKP